MNLYLKVVTVLIVAICMTSSAFAQTVRNAPIELFFRLSVPDECGGWQVKYSDRPEEPFIIVKNTDTDLPFISSYVDYYMELPIEVQQVWTLPDQIFSMKSDRDKAYERDILPDIEVVREGRIDIGAYPAYERVFKSESVNAVYHMVMIQFENGILSMALNSSPSTFENDDEDFMRIIHSIKSKTNNEDGIL